MGQSLGKDFDLENIKDEFLKEAHIVGDLAVLTYPRFLEMLKELNALLFSTTDANGKSLLFVKKGGSDSTIFWKATVKIVCVRVQRGSEDIEECKFLTLRQFIQVYKVIMFHVKPMMESQNQQSNEQGEESETACKAPLQRNPLSTSMILNKIEGGELDTDLEECCICMERKPEITLPCAHSYCLFCIEQWNVSNKTCPVCREDLENTDDSWVLPEIPETSEVSEEMEKVLSVLTKKLPNDSS